MRSPVGVPRPGASVRAMSDDTDTPVRPEAVEASRRCASAVQEVAARFMLDMDMYGEAATIGYEGLAFYFAGRGGVLGDVDHTVVYEAFAFFPAETVQQAWESAASVEDRTASAGRFAAAASAWANRHLPDGALDYTRLAELAGKVVAAADPDGAPVFAGWRDLAEPPGGRELALHRMNALRELRGARHAAAIRAVGLAPVDAFFIRSPYMAGIFGWTEPDTPPSEEAHATWERAEELTDERFGADLAVLSDAELDELCDLTDQLLAAAA